MNQKIETFKKVFSDSKKH